MEALPGALARTRGIYDPYYARVNELFAHYTPEEIAVLHHWFRRANTTAADHLEEHCRTD
ncbi:hypothetical protein ACFUN7_15885 [Streptomyces sp. NPDC057236]|uniref:hypothetical protein n=1 Tax=Streptomyces sp. NPDC057236 TaxID=3346059 RepID=UPI003626B384